MPCKCRRMTASRCASVHRISEVAPPVSRHVGWAKIAWLPASFRLGRKSRRWLLPAVVAGTHRVLPGADAAMHPPDCARGFAAATLLAERPFCRGIDLSSHGHPSTSAGQDQRHQFPAAVFDQHLPARANTNTTETDPTFDHGLPKGCSWHLVRGTRRLRPHYARRLVSPRLTKR